MKRVELDGDVLVFRVKVRGIYRDRIYVRDRRELRGNNVWRRIAHYRALRELEGMGCPPAREGGGEAGATDFPLRGRIDRAECAERDEVKA